VEWESRTSKQWKADDNLRSFSFRAHPSEEICVENGNAATVQLDDVGWI
jgi:hypothetical protein